MLFRSYHINGSVVKGFPKNFDSGVPGLSPLAIADFDNDGNKEVFMEKPITSSVSGCGTKIIRLYRLDGTKLLDKSIVSDEPSEYCENILLIYTHGNFNAPVIGDYDNDDKLEIFITSGKTLHGYKYDGASVSGFPKTIPNQKSGYSYGILPGAVADFNGDGKNEFAYIVSHSYAVKTAKKQELVIQNSSGSIISNFSLKANWHVWGIKAADANGQES